MARKWKRCPALIKLMSQMNAAYPSRDTSSDGSIGDAEHASRSSDHNPWVVDPADNMGVVTAQDIDEDLNATTHSLERVVNEICASRDERVKYIIYEGRMIRSYRAKDGTAPWVWTRYSGKNAHKHHAHISVRQEKKYWNDDRAWSIGVGETTKGTEATAGPDEGFHVVVSGDTLWSLASRYQVSVSNLRWLNGLTSDKILVGQKLRIK